MSEMPLVSVVIPAYNHQQYVIRCLQSVIDQTYQNIEIVFIDDGSRDDTYEVGRQLLEQSGRQFYAEKKANEGLVKTLNYALQSHARGTYVALVASDDWWEATNIEKKVRFLQQHSDHAMVYSSVRIYNNDTDSYKSNDTFFCRGGNIYENLLLCNFIPALTVMFRLDAVKKVGYYDERSVVEDWDLWLRVAQIHKIGFIPEELGCYRMHGSNFSKNYRKMYKYCLHILNKHKDSKGYVYGKRNIKYYYIFNYCQELRIIDALKIILANFGFNIFYYRMFAKYLVLLGKK